MECVVFPPELHIYFGISLLIVWFGHQGIDPTVMVVFNNKNVNCYIYIYIGGGTVFFYITRDNQICKQLNLSGLQQIAGNNKETSKVLYFPFFTLFEGSLFEVAMVAFSAQKGTFLSTFFS